MDSDSQASQGDLLAGWLLRQQPVRSRMGGRPAAAVSGGLRFAFYGRISTAEYQDQASSRAWQYESAADLIAGRGAVVAEYFDVGCSRRLPWEQRPQAAALLAAIADPSRGFDAMVVGEYERAFSGDQLLQLLPLLDRYGIQVWLPEAGGPVNVDDPAHRALILLLGHQSRREILRSRFRTTAAMRAQARDQGRHLGGRPPYGYRLVDAGPHPNAAHAAWGRRRHRLDVDPVTAPHVRWIFAQRLAGHSTAGIARTLNSLGVPSPAAYDRARNRHRSGEGWTLRSVAAILANPRYTGRQVWNRQYLDHNEAVAGDKATSRGAVFRWNPKDQWVLSNGVAHPALVSEEDFVEAQAVNALATPADGRARRYLLTGLVICEICGRRADGHWVHNRPGYRCRHGRTSASPATPGRPKTVYWREDELLTRAAYQLKTDLLVNADHSATAAHLRTRRLQIVCGHTTTMITCDATGPVPRTPTTTPTSGGNRLRGG